MELADWFLDFVVRVKNLRGVVVFGSDREGTVLSGLQWIGKRFRYRDIGFTQTVYEKTSDRTQERLSKKPFTQVSLPSSIMQKVADTTRPSDVDDSFWEGIVTASAYACPLVMVDSLENVVPKDFWVFVARIGQPLDANSAKFHLRVCDYAALDAFGPSTKELLRTAGEPSKGLVALLHERRERAMQDGEKRFWRLAENSGETAVIAILDPLGPA
ncbi:MAG: hypothetical protein GXO73_00970, partial [Calditrichaeota bacterium]|nr:hypothetical protein [Calditrichota bacterium]